MLGHRFVKSKTEVNNLTPKLTCSLQADYSDCQKLPFRANGSKCIGSVEELAHSSPTLALSFPVEVRLRSPPPKTAPYRSVP
jgi:hypothetical protein